MLQPEVQGALLAPRGNGLSAKRSESSTRRAQGAQAPTAAVLKSKAEEGHCTAPFQKRHLEYSSFFKGVKYFEPSHAL